MALVRRDSMLSFRRLAVLLGVSEMTIRRDVTALRAAGRVQVTPGGVKAPSPADDAAVLREQMTVYVEPGVPLRMLRPYLDGVPDLTVVTADLALVHALLEHPTAELILLGGEVARSTRTTHGLLAARALAELSIDVTIAPPGPPAADADDTTPGP